MYIVIVFPGYMRLKIYSLGNLCFREVHYVSENGRIEGLILEDLVEDYLESPDLQDQKSENEIETDNQGGVHYIFFLKNHFY